MYISYEMTEQTDEFQITLPSNSSLDVYKKNRPSNYTVSLPHYVNLEGEWQVAATDIQFTHEWETLVQDHVLGVYVLHRSATKKPVNKYVVAIDQQLNEWRKMEWAKEHEDKFLYRKITVKRGWYPSVKALADHVCTLIADAFVGDFPNFTVQYEHDRTNQRTGPTVGLIPNSDYVIRVADTNSTVMTLLGFKKSSSLILTGDSALAKSFAFYSGYGDGFYAVVDNQHDTMPSIYRAFRVETYNADPAILLDLRSVFVYCDLFDYQIVGDTKAQLMGVVPVVTKVGERTHWTFSPPYYSRVIKNSFKTVKIWLTDHCGEEVRFYDNSDFIVARLHFKRKRRD